MTAVLSLAAARAARGLPPERLRTVEAPPVRPAFVRPLAGPLGSPAGDHPKPEPPEAA